MIGIIAFVGNRSGSLDAIDEIVSKGDVVTLSGRCDQTNRKPECLRCSMDFGA